MLDSITWQMNQFNETYSPEISGSLFTNTPSQAVFERFLPKDFFQENILGIVVGTDGGLILPYLQKKAEETKSIYICIERKKVIDHIISSGWVETEQVKLYSDDFQLITLLTLDRYDEFFFRRALLLLSSIAPIDNKLDYPGLLQKYRQEFNGLTLSQNLNTMSNVFINAQLDNIGDMFNPTQLLKNKFVGKTAVLLGGGPSVSHVLEWVKKNREFLVVFAANRISGRLQSEGISPDFFCAVDPQPALLDYSREMFSFYKESILLCASPMAPNVASQWAGRVLYGDQLLNFLDEKNENICTGPTVMNYALQAAAYFACDHIILAGVDLCFSKEGYTHESSSLEATFGKFLKHGGNQVKTYHGDLANTDIQMAVARETMVTQVKFINTVNPSIRMYQTNPDAAVIEGIELVDLSTFTITDSNTADFMKGIRTSFDWNREEVLSILTKRLDILKSKMTVYQSIRHSIKNVLVDVRRLDRLQNKTFNHAVENVNKTKSKIELKVGDDIYDLFDYAYLDYAKIVSPLEKDGEMTLKEIQSVLLNYFSATDTVLLKFSGQLSKSVDILKLRIQEANGVLDQEMLEQWLVRGEPGRGQVWMAHNSDIVLTREQQVLLEKADQAFVDLLANKVPSFKGQFGDKNYRLSSLWTQVQNAYQKEDTDRLDALAEYLTNEKEESDLNQIGFYANMCALFIKKDYYSALAMKDKISHQKILIPMRKLILKIHTHFANIEEMFTVLEQLIGVAPEYLVQFAVVSGLLGKTELAVEAFQKAVLDAPTDEFIMRQAWQWSQTNQNQELSDWLHEYMQKIMPALFEQLLGVE